MDNNFDNKDNDKKRFFSKGNIFGVIVLILLFAMFIQNIRLDKEINDANIKLNSIYGIRDEISSIKYDVQNELKKQVQVFSESYTDIKSFNPESKTYAVEVRLTPREYTQNDKVYVMIENMKNGNRNKFEAVNNQGKFIALCENLDFSSDVNIWGIIENSDNVRQEYVETVDPKERFVLNIEDSYFDGSIGFEYKSKIVSFQGEMRVNIINPSENNSVEKCDCVLYVSDKEYKTIPLVKSNDNFYDLEYRGNIDEKINIDENDTFTAKIIVEDKNGFIYEKIVEKMGFINGNFESLNYDYSQNIIY